MNRHSLSVLVLYVLLLIPASDESLGSLHEISRNEFLELTPCALLVRVVATQPARERVAMPGFGEDFLFDYEASLLVLEAFGRCWGVASCNEVVKFYYSAEVHSAHPRDGEDALLFPLPVDSGYREAVYGRSYWVVTHEEGKALVPITWKNLFMRGTPLTVLPGEVDAAPITLDEVRLLWGIVAER